jgi:N-acetylmuramic acid 6-phosphate etherase
MISIFTDLTERSPTFGLSPIDTTVSSVKKSWISMFTNAETKYKAWERFLGRRFCGLEKSIFEKHFKEEQDEELRHKALTSLDKTGPDQEDLYDFSLSDQNLASF